MLKIEKHQHINFKNNLFLTDMKYSFFVSVFLHLIIVLFFCITFVKKPIVVSVPIEIMNIEKHKQKPRSENKNLKNNTNEILKKEEPPKIKEKEVTKSEEIPPLKEDKKFKKVEKIQNYNSDEDDDFVPKLSENVKIEKTKTELKVNNVFSETQNVKFEKEFPFNYYARIIKNKINNNLEKTFITGTNAKVVVYFQIQRNGKIKNIKISKKSGYPDFDNSALKSVALSNPFPSLPEDYKGDTLGVYFAFDFIS